MPSATHFRDGPSFLGPQDSTQGIGQGFLQGGWKRELRVNEIMEGKPTAIGN
jgi:hypothetical protein